MCAFEPIIASMVLEALSVNCSATTLPAKTIRSVVVNSFSILMVINEASIAAAVTD